ncbi:pirin family protein [Mesorhizobium denitrificans]|uniref:Pirin family protein n=1 Tax=Mesorhizobium denitrificans TaxID=2294114 RepID=A0A371X3S9_9HYPH|nr:pirin family protein [Mesorhizobium denitrificans]RFC63897.1 pirin family protein [Mesorhizobium denitrificans]
MRKILGIYSSPAQHWVGDGFPVRSMLSYATHGEHVSPFLHLDHAGPTAFSPTDHPRGVGAHPHRGFETVTIVYEGEVEHRDSTGAGGLIGPGDVQWMTAAAGILHEEFHSQAFTEKGGTLDMVQLWINLPAKDKNAAPGYQTLLDGDIPAVALPDGAGVLRVIAGEYQGHKGPARTFSPIDLWDLRLKRGKALSVDLPEGHTAGLVVLRGSLSVNGGVAVRDGQFVLLDREGGAVMLQADTDASILVLSGEPLGEPVAMQGPFVMNTTDELRQAFADFRAGKFGAIAA